MTLYDWLMAAGASCIIGIVVYGFWRAHRIDAIEQPDSWRGQQWPPDVDP